MASEHHRKVGASHPWDKGRLNIPVEPPIGGSPPPFFCVNIVKKGVTFPGFKAIEQSVS